MNTKKTTSAPDKVGASCLPLRKIIIAGTVLAISSLLPCATAFAENTPFLSVDFDADSSSSISATQSGWTQWAISTGDTTNVPARVFTITDPSLTNNEEGKVSVLLTTSRDNNNVLTRNRTDSVGSGFAYSDLYRDMLIANRNTLPGATLTVTFSGLVANREYEVTLYAADLNLGSDIGITTVSGIGSSPWNDIVYTKGDAAKWTADTPLSVAASGNVIRTDSTGSFSFLITNSITNGQGLLNGFQLAAVPVPVPEPAAVAFLTGLSVLFLVASFRHLR
ncbi:MAG: fibronectin type III domain-containing protein [Opitutaceae bacterium]|jgi:hypothetical protein|nr:fibronectin type III domain-containing protein [Opitutaceae bacterium]